MLTHKNSGTWIAGGTGDRRMCHVPSGAQPPGTAVGWSLSGVFRIRKWFNPLSTGGSQPRAGYKKHGMVTQALWYVDVFHNIFFVEPILTYQHKNNTLFCNVTVALTDVLQSIKVFLPHSKNLRSDADLNHILTLVNMQTRVTRNFIFFA